MHFMPLQVQGHSFSQGCSPGTLLMSCRWCFSFLPAATFVLLLKYAQCFLFPGKLVDTRADTGPSPTKVRHDSDQSGT